jgi:23S rRNA (guanosine2251-2'-O)-methyltransferase
VIVYGINAVLEALRAERVESLLVSTRRDTRFLDVLALARERGLRVRRVDQATLDQVAGGGVHQGVVARMAAASRYDVRDLMTSGAAPLIVVLDGIEDPHNVGAILRTVDAAGGSGVVRQLRRAAPLGGAAAKASAGAVAHVRVVEVVNISRAIDELKSAAVWVVGLAADAGTRYDEVDYTLPTAIVLGSEGQGLRRLVREHCDRLVSIPMKGHVESLNVSVAAGIVLFEALRQRGSQETPDAKR